MTEQNKQADQGKSNKNNDWKIISCLFLFELIRFNKTHANIIVNNMEEFSIKKCQINWEKYKNN